MKVDLTQLNLLEDYLKKKGIKYERIDEEPSTAEEAMWNRGFHQIVVPSALSRGGIDYEWDAVCHYGSYGCKEGLLEIMGCLVDYENDGDSVVGWLTAEQVIERIEKKDKDKI